jgi:hypothetical protein
MLWPGLVKLSGANRMLAESLIKGKFAVCVKDAKKIVL